jgi:RHS repeat-associated protein
VKGNNYLYNSGSELNTTTNNYEMFFREYDPALGRMNAVDPMASKYASLTPYNYAFSNPVAFNDPSGADPLENRYQREVDMQRSVAMGRGRIMVNNNLSIYRGGSHITPGSSGHWSDQYSSSYMSAGAFINSALNSQYGGNWSNGQAHFFTSDEEGFFAGARYNTYHNSWGETEHKSFIGSLTAFYFIKEKGTIPTSDVISDMINNPYRYLETASLNDNNYPAYLTWLRVLARILDPLGVPDAVSWSINIDIVHAGGVDISVLTELYILQGKDAGAKLTLQDIGIAVGYDIGISVVGTKYYYTGDIKQLTAKDFTGFRYSASAGYSYYVEIGGGFSIAPVNYGRSGFIIGVSVHLGVSPPGMSGNINTGHTGLKK